MQKPVTNITCICCPFGCDVTISYQASEYFVIGNKCPRGKKYAIEELTAPKRIITTTVKISGGLYPLIPVKTEQPVPKGKIFNIMRILANVTVKPPIKVGDVIVENVADTGVNIVATKTDAAN